MNRKGKRLTPLLGLVAAVVLLAPGFAAWPWVVELHYIQQLGSADKATRNAAALAPGERKSARAVDHLIWLVESGVHRQCIYLSDHDALLTPIFYALWSIGPVALPRLRNSDDGRLQEVANLILDRSREVRLVQSASWRFGDDL